MINKQPEHVFREPFLVTGGPSFNTNDSMLVTGNSNGDLYVRNLIGGVTLQEQPAPSVSEVVLSHTNSHGETFEVMQVKFSVVKRHMLASAYKNGQVVIWDTSEIFKQGPNPASL